VTIGLAAAGVVLALGSRTLTLIEVLAYVDVNIDRSCDRMNVYKGDIMIRLFVVSATALLFTLGTASSAFAAFYGNFSDASGTVSFLNVSDSFGLYQAPTVNVNTLNFSPNLFQTICTNGDCGPGASISDTVVFQVDANAGQFIDDILLSEQGDTNLTEFLAGAIGVTTVTADVFIDIFEVNSVGIPVINAFASMVFTSGGSYSLADEGSGLHGWTGSLMIDLDAILAANAVVGSATLVEISISNTLTAFSEFGAIASIEKKDISGLAITVVPEPGVALLMGLGLAVLASRAPKRD